MRHKVRAGARRGASLVKAAYQWARFRSACPKVIGLIMGVQRSGTGMMVQAFDNDWRCKTFGEDGGLALGPAAGEDMRWRWKPYDEVARILRRQRATLLIAKPLVESQHAEAMLRALPGAKIIWAYRHYQDVAVSGQEHFGLQVIRHNLESLLARRDHWYAENTSEEIRSLVARYYFDDRPEQDLRALGWYVRNSLVFRYNHLPVMLSSYEELVTAPAQMMRTLYEFLGHPYPGDHIVRHIHVRSVQRGKDLRISSDIRALCDSMLERLERHARESRIARPGAGAVQLA